MSRRPRIAIAAVAKRVRAFGALLERLLPPKKVPAIQSAQEAEAIRRYLLAEVHGDAERFAADEPFQWALVQRVLERAPQPTRVAAPAVECWNDASHSSANG